MSAKKGYKNVLVGKTIISAVLYVIDTSKDAGKAQVNAREDNNNAYHDLILSDENKIAFKIIDKAITTGLPDGDASLAWKRLSSKYDSKSLTVMVG